MKAPSLTRTLYLNIIGSLLILWLLVGSLTAWVANRETQEIFDSGLQETAQRLLALVLHDIKGHAPDAGLEIAEPMDHDEYLTYQVWDLSGKLLVRSHKAPDEPYPVPLRVGLYEVNSQKFYVESSKDGQYFIQVAERIKHRQHTQLGIVLSMLLPLLAMLPISALIIFFAVKRSQRSIVNFGQEIAARDSSALHPITLEGLPREFIDLVGSINSLMHRLQIALNAERNFTANSAHELRTPIAAALAQLDVLKNEILPFKTKARLLEAQEMIKQLECITVKLLQLAKAESSAAFALQPIDLTRLVRMLIRDIRFRTMHHLDIKIPSDAVIILGDLDALGIAIQNLLENAVQYSSEPAQAIQIECTSDGLLSIKNDCPAIEAEILNKLKQRFIRDSSIKRGVGLGLSITEAILNQCKANFQIESPCYPNGRGFSCTIAFQMHRKPN